MKKLILMLMLCMPLATFAQKFGHVNAQDIMQSMPEFIKARGEVEFILDDYDNAAILPIEVKSGKDYTIHRALNTFLSNPHYRVHHAYVLSNAKEIRQEGYVTYLPIYYVMFIKENPPKEVILNL